MEKGVFSPEKRRSCVKNRGFGHGVHARHAGGHRFKSCIAHSPNPLSIQILRVLALSPNRAKTVKNVNPVSTSRNSQGDARFSLCSRTPWRLLQRELRLAAGSESRPLVSAFQLAGRRSWALKSRAERVAVTCDVEKEVGRLQRLGFRAGRSPEPSKSASAE